MTKIDNKNNLSSLKFFIIHGNIVSLEPEDEHYGEADWQKFVLDKTVDEIMIATEQVPAIIKIKNNTNDNNINITQYIYHYLASIFLDENNDVLRITNNNFAEMEFNIDENSYPYIIMEVPTE